MGGSDDKRTQVNDSQPQGLFVIYTPCNKEVVACLLFDACGAVVVVVVYLLRFLPKSIERDR